MKAILNWRNWVYMILGGFAVVMLFAVPEEDSKTWFADMLLSKSLAIAAFYVLYKLLVYWDKNGKIPELSKLMEED